MPNVTDEMCRADNGVAATQLDWDSAFQRAMTAARSMATVIGDQ